jgi:uncharacterized LabA/DUF88 family protein
LPTPDRLNIAVFIDFDNIEIGVKTTLGQQFDVGVILDAIKERGEVVTKIAYADWTRSGEYSRSLTQHAIRLVQRNMTPGGDKNGADINLALDALEMAFTHQHINAYVIVGGDSDFLSLVEKLKQYDKKVFVVGGRAFTSMILQRNCHEFIAYENLHGVRKQAAKTGRPMPASAVSAPLTQAVPLVRRALKILADREVSPQTGLLKSTLLQLDSTFSERNYGASSFLDFVEKLSQAGVVTLKHAGRSVMVELNESFDESAFKSAVATEAALPPAHEGFGAPRPAPSEGTSDLAHPPSLEGFGGPRPESLVAQPSSQGGFGTPRAPYTDGSRPAHEIRPAPMDMPPQIGDNAEGVRVAGRILTAARGARWPMYLRNVKQILRQTEGGFDERRYGFGGLMDLLKGCQREGFVRIERDRRGGLRVFQGPQLLSGAAVVSRPILPQPDVEDTFESQPIDIRPIESSRVDEPLESEESAPQPNLIDTTAELLGRAKPRPRRARATRLASAPVKKAAAAAKKPAARRSTRGKKAAATEANDNTEG